jgi:hypothetical protein
METFWHTKALFSPKMLMNANESLVQNDEAKMPLLGFDETKELLAQGREFGLEPHASHIDTRMIHVLIAQCDARALDLIDATAHVNFSVIQHHGMVDLTKVNVEDDVSTFLDSFNTLRDEVRFRIHGVWSLIKGARPNTIIAPGHTPDDPQQFVQKRLHALAELAKINQLIAQVNRTVTEQVVLDTLLSPEALADDADEVFADTMEKSPAALENLQVQVGQIARAFDISDERIDAAVTVLSETIDEEVEEE